MSHAVFWSLFSASHGSTVYDQAASVTLSEHNETRKPRPPTGIAAKIAGIISDIIPQVYK
ncbi:hypothetical protein AL525_001810 [Citrobacter amalonaticus]|nr:hypothetical protein AL525_001810 [Citrobacter amalonaticus]